MDSELYYRKRSLLAACKRILEVKAAVDEIPAEPRKWFMNKPGHADCFIVAKALKKILEEKREGDSAS